MHKLQVHLKKNQEQDSLNKQGVQAVTLMNENLLNKAGIEIAEGMGSLKNDSFQIKDLTSEGPLTQQRLAEKDQVPESRAFKIRSNAQHDDCVSMDQKVAKILLKDKKKSSECAQDSRKNQKEITRTETNNWRKKSLMRVTDMAQNLEKSQAENSYIAERKFKYHLQGGLSFQQIRQNLNTTYGGFTSDGVYYHNPQLQSCDCKNRFDQKRQSVSSEYNGQMFQDVIDFKSKRNSRAYSSFKQHEPSGLPKTAGNPMSQEMGKRSRQKRDKANRSAMDFPNHSLIMNRKKSGNPQSKKSHKKANSSLDKTKEASSISSKAQMFRHRPGQKLYTHVKKSLDLYHKIPTTSASQHIVKSMNISELLNEYKACKASEDDLVQVLNDENTQSEGTKRSEGGYANINNGELQEYEQPLINIGAGPMKIATTQNSHGDEPLNNSSHRYSQSKSNELLSQVLDAKRDMEQTSRSNIMNNQSIFQKSNPDVSSTANIEVGVGPSQNTSDQRPLHQENYSQPQSPQNVTQVSMGFNSTINGISSTINEQNQSSHHFKDDFQSCNQSKFQQWNTQSNPYSCGYRNQGGNFIALAPQHGPKQGGQINMSGGQTNLTGESILKSHMDKSNEDENAHIFVIKGQQVDQLKVVLQDNSTATERYSERQNATNDRQRSFKIPKDLNQIQPMKVSIPFQVAQTLLPINPVPHAYSPQVQIALKRINEERAENLKMQKNGYVFANIPDVNMNHFKGNIPQISQMIQQKIETKDPLMEEVSRQRTSSLLKRASGGTVVDNLSLYDQLFQKRKFNTSNFVSSQISINSQQEAAGIQYLNNCSNIMLAQNKPSSTSVNLQEKRNQFNQTSPYFNTRTGVPVHHQPHSRRGLQIGSFSLEKNKASKHQPKIMNKFANSTTPNFKSSDQIGANQSNSRFKQLQSSHNRKRTSVNSQVSQKSQATSQEFNLQNQRATGAPEAKTTVFIKQTQNTSGIIQKTSQEIGGNDLQSYFDSMSKQDQINQEYNSFLPRLPNKTQDLRGVESRGPLDRYSRGGTRSRKSSLGRRSKTRNRSGVKSNGEAVSQNSHRTNKTHIVTINEDHSKSQSRQIRSIEHDSPTSYTYWQQQPIKNISPNINDERNKSANSGLQLTANRSNRKASNQSFRALQDQGSQDKTASAEQSPLTRSFQVQPVQFELKQNKNQPEQLASPGQQFINKKTKRSMISKHIVQEVINRKVASISSKVADSEVSVPKQRVTKTSVSPKKVLQAPKIPNKDLQIRQEQKPSARVSGQPSSRPSATFDVHSGKIFNSVLMNEAATGVDNSFNLQVIGNASHKTPTQQDELLTTPKMFNASICLGSADQNNQMRENTQSFAGGGRNDQSDLNTSMGSQIKHFVNNNQKQQTFRDQQTNLVTLKDTVIRMNLSNTMTPIEGLVEDNQGRIFVNEFDSYYLDNGNKIDNFKMCQPDIIQTLKKDSSHNLHNVQKFPIDVSPVLVGKQGSENEPFTEYRGKTRGGNSRKGLQSGGDEEQMAQDQANGSIEGQIDTILSKRAQDDDNNLKTKLTNSKGKQDEYDEDVVIMKDEGIQLTEHSIDPISREDQIQLKIDTIQQPLFHSRTSHRRSHRDSKASSRKKRNQQSKSQLNTIEKGVGPGSNDSNENNKIRCTNIEIQNNPVLTHRQIDEAQQQIQKIETLEEVRQMQINLINIQESLIHQAKIQQLQSTNQANLEAYRQQTPEVVETHIFDLGSKESKINTQPEAQSTQEMPGDFESQDYKQFNTDKFSSQGDRVSQGEDFQQIGIKPVSQADMIRPSKKQPVDPIIQIQRQIQIPPLVQTSHSQQRPKIGAFKGSLQSNKLQVGLIDLIQPRREDSFRIHEGPESTSDRSLLLNMNYMQQLSQNIELLQIKEMELRARMDSQKVNTKYYDASLEQLTAELKLMGAKKRELKPYEFEMPTQMNQAKNSLNIYGTQSNHQGNNSNLNNYYSNNSFRNDSQDSHGRGGIGTSQSQRRANSRILKHNSKNKFIFTSNSGAKRESRTAMSNYNQRQKTNIDISELENTGPRISLPQKLFKAIKQYKFQNNSIETTSQKSPIRSNKGSPNSMLREHSNLIPIQRDHYSFMNDEFQSARNSFPQQTKIQSRRSSVLTKKTNQPESINFRQKVTGFNEISIMNSGRNDFHHTLQAKLQHSSPKKHSERGSFRESKDMKHIEYEPKVFQQVLGSSKKKFDEEQVPVATTQVIGTEASCGPSTRSISKTQFKGINASFRVKRHSPQSIHKIKATSSNSNKDSRSPEQNKSSPKTSKHQQEPLIAGDFDGSFANLSPDRGTPMMPNSSNLITPLPLAKLMMPPQLSFEANQTKH